MLTTNRFSLIYGFALFSMFFGSGNLVFPLQIGQLSGNSWIFGFLGLLITGIILPFFGLFVIKLYNGNYTSFFAEGGFLAKIILPLFTLSLLGAFAVVPRCITVAHAGLNDIFPTLSLTLFSLIFCIICYFSCLKNNRMITIIGKWMTPFLLFFLFLLIILGILTMPTIPESDMPSSTAFSNGFMVGYQTMDLFAAFFFSALIFKQIQDKLPPQSSTRDIIRIATKPSLIGASLLGIIYLGFVFLGSAFQSQTLNVAPELMLPTIATTVLGAHATLFIGIIVIFSCLTTAIALNNIYASYLCTVLKLAPQRFPFMLFITTFVSFIISLFDFRGIASFLAPVLEMSYPSIIYLTILCLITPNYKWAKIIGFYGILASTVIFKLFVC